ncbi:MAG: hypothetical protein ISS36_03995 [Candidatus Aenigmarchaeota archaeon]|nr:hypothetical protein [Candidatus Aenigmarchaeota archaeon]
MISSVKQIYEGILLAKSTDDYKALVRQYPQFGEDFETFDELAEVSRLERYNTGRKALFERMVVYRLVQDGLEPTVELVTGATQAKPHLAFEVLRGSKLEIDPGVVIALATEYLTRFACDGHRLYETFEACPESMFGIKTVSVPGMDGTMKGPVDSCQDFLFRAKEGLEVYGIPLGHITERMLEKGTPVEALEHATDLSPGRIFRIGEDSPLSFRNLEWYNPGFEALIEIGDMYIVDCVELDESGGRTVKLSEIDNQGNKGKFITKRV